MFGLPHRQAALARSNRQRRRGLCRNSLGIHCWNIEGRDGRSNNGSTHASARPGPEPTPAALRRGRRHRCADVPHVAGCLTAVPVVSAVPAVPFDSSFPKETHREVFRIGAYDAPQCCPALLRRPDGYHRHRRERPCENGNETERPDTSDKTRDQDVGPGCPHGEARRAHPRGQGRPAVRGHPLPRPPARRCGARTGRRHRVRRRRNDPPDRGEVPSRRRQRSRADLGKEAAQADAGADRERRARVQLFLAPREHRGRPPPQPPPPHPRAGRLRAAARHRRVRARTAEDDRQRVEAPAAALLRRCADRAGADRAPDGSAAQEHPGRAARHRAAARRARPAAHRARTLVQRIDAARA